MRWIVLLLVVIVSLVVGVWIGNALGSWMGMTPLGSPLNLYVVTVHHWMGLLIGAGIAVIVMLQLQRRWREHDAERAMFRRARTEAQIRQIKY